MLYNVKVKPVVVYLLPKYEHVKNQWLKFIFTMISQQYNLKRLLRSIYFTYDCVIIEKLENDGQSG